MVCDGDGGDGGGGGGGSGGSVVLLQACNSISSQTRAAWRNTVLCDEER